MFRVFNALLRAICPLLIGLAVVGAPVQTSAREADWARVGDRAMASVVRLEQGDGAATGSGFVVDPAGYVLTNAHVVGEAQSLTVRFEDGRRFTARVMHLDGWVDLALLRIDAPGPFPALTFAASSARRGEPVAALGSPFDYLFSLSRGIVSGFDRTYTEQDAVGFLQHDAAINPGSSGGPLVDRRGQVIGVNAATPPEARTDIGIGLAIPAEVARRFIARAHDPVERDHGVLGVRTRQVTPDLARLLDLPAVEGLLVEHVAPSSAAASAGLQVGDVIRTLDASPLTTPRRLGALLWLRAPGDRVELGVDRAGQRVTLAAVLAEPSSDVRFGQPGDAAAPRGAGGRSRRYGLALQWRTDGSESGLEVSTVAPRSPAAAAGLAAGDRVLTLNGQSPETLAAAEAILDGAQETLVALVARSGAEQQYVVLSRSAAQTLRMGATF